MGAIRVEILEKYMWVLLLLLLFPCINYVFVLFWFFAFKNSDNSFEFKAMEQTAADDYDDDDQNDIRRKKNRKHNQNVIEELNVYDH